MCLRPIKSATIEAPQKAPRDSSRGALNGSKAKLGAINKVVMVSEDRDIKVRAFWYLANIVQSYFN